MRNGISNVLIQFQNGVSFEGRLKIIQLVELKNIFEAKLSKVINNLFRCHCLNTFSKLNNSAINQITLSSPPTYFRVRLNTSKIE